MIKPRTLPECNRCEFYGRSQYLICAIYPTGCPDNQCLDFRPAPDVKQELWAPEGYSWYGEDLIQNTPIHLNQSDRLHLLQTHPLFTGTCPACGYHFTDSPEVHWDCPACAWKDDSV